MKRAAYAVGAIVLAAVVAALLLGPALVNRPAVQAEIQQRLSKALQGQVTWETLDVALFPAPHGELRKLRVEVPEKLAASADNVNVYLRLWPLLRGRVEIASLTLKKPSIRLGAGGEGSTSDAPFDPLTAYRAAMEPTARALLEFAPDTAVKLEEASVEIGPEFTLRDLRADARTDGKGVDLQLSTGASLWKRLSVEARVDYADLAAHAAIALEALAIDKDIPPATLRAKLSTDGKSGLEGDFDGNVGGRGADGERQAPRARRQAAAAQPPSSPVLTWRRCWRSPAARSTAWTSSSPRRVGSRRKWGMLPSSLPGGCSSTSSSRTPQ